MTRTGYTPAMLRRHPGLREPWRLKLSSAVAIVCLFLVAALFTALALGMARLP